MYREIHSDHRNNYLNSIILDTEDAKKLIKIAQNSRMPGVRRHYLTPEVQPLRRQHLS